MTATKPRRQRIPRPSNPLSSWFRGLAPKLLAAFLVIGIVPMAVIGIFAINRSNEALLQTSTDRVGLAALELMETIDASLGDRFGDAHAFSANPLVLGSLDEATEAVNLYMETYEVYDLMVVAEADGTVHAVNTIDGAGNALDTDHLVGTNVSAEDWFQVVSTDSSPTGEVYLTDAAQSELVTEVYGDDRLTIGFTAPIRDTSGAVIGVWHNEASFEHIVVERVAKAREELEGAGLHNVETQVLRSDGVVLDDAEASAILSLNLAEAGVEAAALATAGDGSSGVVQESNARHGAEQLTGAGGVAVELLGPTATPPAPVIGPSPASGGGSWFVKMSPMRPNRPGTCETSLLRSPPSRFC